MPELSAPPLTDDDDTLTRWATMSDADRASQRRRRRESQPDGLIWLMLVALAFGPAIGYFLAQLW